ncbi:cyclase family protein [Puniceicoccaceae bacterium K14]|nr:cyclase family protein [Puniceicoccaceae bacterium K14]
MTKIIDLTMAMRPGVRGYACKISHRKETEGWNARTLTLYSHTGTHMDAPLHFIKGGNTIDKIDLNKCVGDCVRADLRPVAPKALITIEDLGEIAQNLQKGDRLILQTGWSQHVENTLVYRDKLPRISRELAHLLAEKEIGFLGVEPPSVADVNNLTEVTEIHEILLKAEIVIAEGLCNLDALGNSPFTIVALPLKPEGADGCPARIIALQS